MLSGLLAVLLLSQCATTEEIWINPDQSLRREFTMDMSTFMPMIKMSMEQEEEPDSQAAGDPEDTMEELFKRSELDTVISFADMMSDELNMGELSKEEILQRIEEEEGPDMSPEEKEKAVEAIRALMDMEVRLRLSDSQNRYDMTFLQEFEDVNAMNEGANLFKSLSELADESEEMPADEEAMSGLMGGNATYSLGKKTFGIRRPAPDLSELQQDEEMGMLMPMLENMENQLIIHVPKKVKKVNLKEAEIDGNTVRVSIPAFPEEGKPFELELKYK